jgi:hypothetical protein
MRSASSAAQYRRNQTIRLPRVNRQDAPRTMPDDYSATADALQPAARPATTSERLDARYGRTPGAQARGRRGVIVAAIAFVIVFAAWVVWGGLSGTNATLEVRDLGYSATTDTAITVRWEVSTDPGTEVTCALQALNSSFGIVGWRIVELGASDRRTRVFEERLRTAEPAVTGLPYRCWLP